MPATVRQCWLLIRKWEAEKVKAEQDKAELERKRNAPPPRSGLLVTAPFVGSVLLWAGTNCL